MHPTGRTSWLIRGAVAVLCGGVLVGAARSPALGHSAWEMLCFLAVGVLHAEVGLWLWRNRDDSPMGPLMVAAAGLWLGEGLGRVLWPGLFVDSFMLGLLYQPVLLHCVLIIPNGRLVGWADRGVAAAGYLFWPVVAVVQGHLGFPDVRRLLALRAVGYPIVGAALLAYFALRYLRARPADRRAMLPIALANTVNIIATVTVSATWYVHGSWPRAAYYVGAALVPIGAALSVLRGQPVPIAMRALVSALGREESDVVDLRDSLRRALDDPTLELLEWRDGALVDLVTGTPGVATTPLTRGGRQVGGLRHKPSIDTTGDVYRAVQRMAALALDNRRLLDQVQRQLQDVRDSRRRLVEAGDAERRRVERNVHDGVQQRLIAASLLLHRAGRPGADVAKLVAQGAAEIDCGINELREIVRGMSPAVLVHRGLVGAVESIAERSRVIVDIDDHLGARDLPEDLAVAAYYVILESVTNAEKHAGAATVEVRLAVAGDLLAVAIADDGAGTAAFAEGGGLIGIRDRVEACGGELSVTSKPGAGTTVLAHLPLPGEHR